MRGHEGRKRSKGIKKATRKLSISRSCGLLAASTAVATAIDAPKAGAGGSKACRKVGVAGGAVAVAVGRRRSQDEAHDGVSQPSVDVDEHSLSPASRRCGAKGGSQSTLPSVRHDDQPQHIYARLDSIAGPTELHACALDLCVEPAQLEQLERLELARNAPAPPSPVALRMCHDQPADTSWHLLSLTLYSP